MSKIEIECRICQAILRVESRFAGKQARCPSCGGLTKIPGEQPSDVAVQAPPAVDMPFQETFYRDSDDENSKAVEPSDSSAANEFGSNTTDSGASRAALNTEEPANSSSSSSSDTGYRPSGSLAQPRPRYRAGESAPLYGDRLVITDDSDRGSPKSILAGLLSLALLVASLASLPVCFCFTPIILFTANSLSRRGPAGLHSFNFAGIMLVGIIWIVRMLLFFVTMR